MDKFKTILVNRNLRVGKISFDEYLKFVKGELNISYIMNSTSMKSGNFYCISYPRRGASTFEEIKVVNSRRAKLNTFAIESRGYYEQSDIVITTIKSDYKDSIDIYYLLSLLNSKLYFKWFYFKGKRKGETLELFQKPITEVPIKLISKMEQKPFINLVDIILKKKEKNEDTTAEERGIDMMVYKLYELTYEEVKVVEPEFAMSREEYEKL